MQENDPLWAMRHGLAGIGAALVLSVPLAALLGSTLAGFFDDSYGSRVAVYGVLLAYVLVGAVVLFVRVAQHEKKPLGIGRLGVWLISLWLWPALLISGRKS